MEEVKQPPKKKPGSLVLRQQRLAATTDRMNLRNEHLVHQEQEQEQARQQFLAEAKALLLAEGQPFCNPRNNKYIYALIEDSSSVNQDKLLIKVVARGFDPNDAENDELLAKWASVHYPYQRDDFVNTLNECGVSFADGLHTKVIEGIFFGTDFEGSKPCYVGRFNKVILSLKRCGFDLVDTNNAELIGKIFKTCPPEISCDLKETLDGAGYVPCPKVQTPQLKQAHQTFFENLEA